jgi:nucleoside phosphorylase
MDDTTVDTKVFRSELADYEKRMCHKWYKIGIKLMQNVQDLSGEPESNLGKILDRWLENPPEKYPVGWESIVRVLESEGVQLKALAKDIRKEKMQNPGQVGKQRMEQDGNEGDCPLDPSATGPVISPTEETQRRDPILGSGSQLKQYPKGTGSNPGYNIKFAIMTANDNEWESACHFLKCPMNFKNQSKWHEKVKAAMLDDDKCLAGKVEFHEQISVYYVVSVDGVHGVLLKCSNMGSFTKGGSHRTTLQLLKYASREGWDLRLIFIIGCCGTRTKPTKEQPDLIHLASDDKPEIPQNPPLAQSPPEEPGPEGMILVAEHIIQYAIGKFKEGKIEYGGKPHDVTYEWPGRVVWAQSVGKHIRNVYEAGFLSGDFVIKDENVAEDLATILRNQKMVGFEMEGVGVKKAIEDYKLLSEGFDKLGIVLVKGVSDQAEKHKNKDKSMEFFSEELKDVDEDSRQQMCTIMSLCLVLRAIIAGKNDFN